MYFKQQDGDGISAIHPTTYQARFVKRAVMEVFDGIEQFDPSTRVKSSAQVSEQAKKNIDAAQKPKTDRRFTAAPISNDTAVTAEGVNSERKKSSKIVQSTLPVANDMYEL